jgi:hypothetical protein
LSFVALGVVGLLAVGCGHKTGRTSGDASVDTESVALPDWAPENPSPEFLRAVKVLKPLPAKDASDPSSAAAAAADRLIYAATYEFFGTLSDKQIERLLAAKELKIPVKSLSEEQRSALGRWFDVWREAMRGVSAVHTSGDRLVDLYRFEAEKDLSNVSVGFNVSGHAVNMRFWIRQQDGSEKHGFGNTFATI